RARDLRRLVHHAAMLDPPTHGKERIDAHLPHVVFAGLLPSKLAGIEVECLLPVTGEEFVPADMAGRANRHRRLVRTVRLEKLEHRTLWIRDDGETADVRYVLGLAVHRAAGFLQRLGLGIDVVRIDIADPRGVAASLTIFLRHRHDAADPTLA